MRVRGPRALQALVVTGSLAALFAASMPDDKHLVDWVQKKIQALQPSRGERRIDEIGWANGILQAEQLGRAHKRPVFLFTYDGRIETGRC